MTKKKTTALEKVKQPTLKQYEFVLAYLGEARGNATLAARMAGYKTKDKDSADDVLMRNVAKKTLRTPVVQELIARLRKDTERKARKSIMSAHETLVRASQIADGSLADVLNEHGEFDIEDARRRGTDYLIRSVRTRRTIIHRPRYSRRRAGANAEYVQPKHDFRLTPDKTYLCVGCEAEVDMQVAIAKITAGEVCTMKADNDVERVEYVQHEYKIEDRNKALDMLMKYHRLYGEREDFDVDEEIAKILGLVGTVPRGDWGPIIDTVGKVIDASRDSDAQDLGDIDQ